MEESPKVKNKEILDKITPTRAKKLLMAGNDRFLAQELIERNHDWHIQKTIDAQHPFAIIHSCIDSRVLPELIFDQGIGDLFVSRVAGNFINKDTLGNMEYACAISGSKLIVVLGHTSCGAIKGACDNVILGNLSDTLKNLKPAINSIQTSDDYDRSSKNIDFVNKVAYQNIKLAISNIKLQSSVLKKLYTNGDIDIVGAFYDHKTGKVEFCK